MLAHQGGWDEVLLVVGPMIVIVLLLRLAKRRVDRLGSAERIVAPTLEDADGERTTGAAPPPAPPD